MRRIYKIGILGVSAMALVGLGIYFLTTKDQNKDRQNIPAAQVTYKDPNTEVVLKHPEHTKVSEMSADDKKANIILRLTEEKGQKPYLITLRSESGLKVVATLTRTEIIDAVMGSSEKALPQRFQGFRKESDRRYEHKGRKAGEIIFTYDSPVEGQRIKQRFVVLVKDADTAVYLAMQAKEADFGKYNANIFDSMAKSLDFQ